MVRRAGPAAHLLLHCAPHDAAALGAAAGVELGAAMLRATTRGEWHSLHLAPDEWLLIGPAGGELRFDPGLPHALVDIGERSFGLEIEGPLASALLAAGCPLDLDERAFPASACTRTLFGKVMVMLWRTRGGFVMEYARSFDGYVVEFVTLAAEDAA